MSNISVSLNISNQIFFFYFFFNTRNAWPPNYISFPSSKEIISQAKIKLPTTMFSLGTSPLPSDSLRSSWTRQATKLHSITLHNPPKTECEWGTRKLWQTSGPLSKVGGIGRIFNAPYHYYHSFKNIIFKDFFQGQEIIWNRQQK